MEKARVQQVWAIGIPTLPIFEFFSSRQCLKAMRNSLLIEDQIVDIGVNFMTDDDVQVEESDPRPRRRQNFCGGTLCPLETVKNK